MSKSINKLIDEQIKRWQLETREKKPVQQKINVITISREAGSQGGQLAQALCLKTGFDLFDHEIVDAMVETSKNTRILLETLDERRMNVVEDVVSNFINEHHLWPDEYSKLLLKILNTIGNHGNAIILGRGANCVMSGPNVLRVRVVAPMNERVRNVQHSQDLKKDDAKKYIVSMDSNRTAFVKRYFNCDATDPANYDLIINTGRFPVEKAVQVIDCALK